MPLGETDLPMKLPLERKARIEALLNIITWCDVEHSPRYKRTKTSTWCNIYATDVCYLAGVYLPHTFWTAKALKDILAGKAVAPKYGVTITELSANSLRDWLVYTGPLYGWRPAKTAAEAQKVVNEGGMAVVCAKKPKGIGHVSVVIPETPAKKAHYAPDGRLLIPVQSQAGAKNYSAYTTEMGVWWERPGYEGGIWVQEYAPKCPTCSGTGISP